MSAQIEDNNLKNQSKKKIAEESEKTHNQTCSDIGWFSERQKISLPTQINNKCLSKYLIWRFKLAQQNLFLVALK